MDRGAWRATVHGVSESDRTEPLILSLSPTAQQVKEAPCNARVGVFGSGKSMEEEMATTPVFLPEKSHGQRSLMGYSPCSHKESDMTE